MNVQRFDNKQYKSKSYCTVRVYAYPKENIYTVVILADRLMYFIKRLAHFITIQYADYYT